MQIVGRQAFRHKLLVLGVRKVVAQHRDEWLRVLAGKKYADALGVPDRIEGALRCARQKVEDNEFLIAATAAFHKAAGGRAVAAHEGRDGPGLSNAEAGAVDNLVEGCKPRVDDHQPARGVLAAA